MRRRSLGRCRRGRCGHYVAGAPDRHDHDVSGEQKESDTDVGALMVRAFVFGRGCGPALNRRLGRRRRRTLDQAVVEATRAALPAIAPRQWRSRPRRCSTASSATPGEPPCGGARRVLRRSRKGKPRSAVSFYEARFDHEHAAPRRFTTLKALRAPDKRSRKESGGGAAESVWRRFSGGQRTRAGKIHVVL
jgi:hypothetical protein